MYLKNGLIEFLKVKNVILLILGVIFTSISFSLMTQLVVGLHGDFLSIFIDYPRRQSDRSVCVFRLWSFDDRIFENIAYDDQ